uniref:Transmembrane protein 230 n=1 Tax=Globisporangium ultimum (strain ATCC 200006 / CBS 805.95 / DAOM BR144) TaxID=431595 RepID=K3X3J5_GLOUD
MAKDVRAAGVSEVRRQEKVGGLEAKFHDIAKREAQSSRFTVPEYETTRRKKFPIRTGLAAVSLFTLGSIMIFASTRIGLDGEHRGLSFLILGLIAFIPGSYASYQLYGSYKGWKGYDYSQIPSYDD